MRQVGRGPTRRNVMCGAAGLLVAGTTGATIMATSSPDHESDKVERSPEEGDASPAEPFFGPHQAGIATPQQGYLTFAAFDVTCRTRDELAGLIASWTAIAAIMTAGKTIDDHAPAHDQPPVDTGESLDLTSAHLTLTFGVGPSLFDDRFGLTRQRPAALAPLPAFSGDRLDLTRSNGDLCIQACADDPQVVFHAIRVLTRIGHKAASLRWLQAGFQPSASAVSLKYPSPRNLMGFKDGTNNIVAEDPVVMAENVWIGEADPSWMHGGTYVVTRRIQIRFDAWDSASLSEQEKTFGRQRLSGAPLGSAEEHDPVPLAAKNSDGSLVIPADAHVRLAAPAENGGIHLLRRGYSYSDGIDQQTGQLDAGLFFIAYQRDPRRQFVPLQRKLAANDALNRFIVHTRSSIFACPGGVQPGYSWLDGLLRAR